MSITNDIVTFAGNIGNDPTKNETRAGTPVVNFRVGSSSGYFDQRAGAWVDGGTNWYAVAAYGKLAEHAKASLHRGDAVIVSGRLKVKEWEANGKKGVDLDIVADAIGHDLNFGTSAFLRRLRAVAAEQALRTPSRPMDTLSEEDAPTPREQGHWDAGGPHEVNVRQVADDGTGNPTDDAEVSETFSYA